MPKFTYKGRNANGVLVFGTYECNASSDCARMLIQNSVTPISIHEMDASKVLKSKPRRGKKKPEHIDLMFFCRQMHTLSKSGVPLIRGLNGLVETTRNDVLSNAIRDVIRNLEGGYSLSQSLTQHHEIFSPMFIGMLQVGERSGRIDETFDRLAFYLERERNNRAMIKAALRYPITVLVVIAAAVMAINLFIIPAFSSTFERLHAELPLATRILLASSQFTLHYWYLILTGAALTVFLFMRFIRTGPGKLWWDYTKLHLPIVGTLLTKTVLARFSRTFAMTLKSGVPIVQGLVLLNSAIDNAYMVSVFNKLRKAIERGDSLSHTAAGLKLFPPLVLQMLEVGEETGRLDEMLSSVADFYDEEVDAEVKNLGQAIEPILLFVVGGLVLALAMGVFMPMWNMGSAAMPH